MDLAKDGLRMRATSGTGMIVCGEGAGYELSIDKIRMLCGVGAEHHCRQVQIELPHRL
jgi:hypothetical protein